MLKKSYSTGTLYKKDFIVELRLNVLEIQKPFVVVNSWCFDESESENEFKCPSPPKKSKKQKNNIK